MSEGLKVAFKEWAAICQALGQGRQSIVLRKGGIAENFEPEQTRFWLFPTYLHQQETSLRDDARPLLEQALADKPTDDMVHLSHFAEVTGIYHVRELMPALMLAHLHLLSEATVRQRFEYRTPGLYVFCLRVFAVPVAHALPSRPEYAGCKSWVELEQPLSIVGARPVILDQQHDDVQKSLDMLLNPTAFA